MLKGKLTIAGTMDVDGEELTGIFIEIPVEELKINKMMIYNNVEVRPLKTEELNAVKSEAGDRDKPDLAGIQRASHESAGWYAMPPGSI